MKHLFATILISCFFFIGCKKDIITIPTADFSFRGDTSSVFKMATYDTCTLINNSVNSDSSYWNLGNGNISRDKNLVLTYANSGTYNIKLTVKNKDGQETSTTKKVIVLDRVLKKIIIKKFTGTPFPTTFQILIPFGLLHLKQTFLCKCKNFHGVILLHPTAA
jgi:hypothetical protein